MDDGGAQSSWDGLVAKLQRERDALALKIHLGKQEALDEWERLETKWNQLKSVKGPPMKEAAAETARGVGSALESAASELKKGYEKIRKLLLIVFGAAVLFGYGCSDDERHEAFSLDGDIYTETFTCNQTFTGQPTTCPDLNETDQLQFQRSGLNTYQVRTVPDSGFVINGSLVGLVFSWNATSDNGYTESGTWTFSSNGNTFSGASHYVANNGSYSGDCNTNGDIGLSAPPDPPPPTGCP